MGFIQWLILATDVEWDKRGNRVVREGYIYFHEIRIIYNVVSVLFDGREQRVSTVVAK